MYISPQIFVFSPPSPEMINLFQFYALWKVACRMWGWQDIKISRGPKNCQSPQYTNYTDSTFKKNHLNEGAFADVALVGVRGFEVLGVRNLVRQRELLLAHPAYQLLCLGVHDRHVRFERPGAWKLELTFCAGTVVRNFEMLAELCRV